MKNYEQLFGKLATLLRPGGLCFFHIFTCNGQPYHFEEGWMADEFFTGGQMPSTDLLLHFQRDLALEQSWIMSGVEYQKTLEAWLRLLDENT